MPTSMEPASTSGERATDIGLICAPHRNARGVRVFRKKESHIPIRGLIRSWPGRLNLRPCDRQARNDMFVGACKQVSSGRLRGILVLPLALFCKIAHCTRRDTGTTMLNQPSPDSFLSSVRTFDRLSGFPAKNLKYSSWLKKTLT
jgi:hypothetical protein